MKKLSKGIISRLISPIGYELKRKLPKLSDAMDFHSVSTVFEVGANVGQFSEELRASGFTGLIHSFEPMEATFSQIEKAARKDPK